MKSVCRWRNTSACIKLPMVRARNRVERFASSLDADFESCGTTPDSFSRLPNINVATSGADCGTRMPTTRVTTIGKAITAVRPTGRGAYSMRIRRSARVVMSRMIGGWMIGTRLI